jgi:hypothetical protein
MAAILKHYPDALDALVSISPKFEKLRSCLKTIQHNSYSG